MNELEYDFQTKLMQPIVKHLKKRNPEKEYSIEQTNIPPSGPWGRESDIFTIIRTQRKRFLWIIPYTSKKRIAHVTCNSSGDISCESYDHKEIHEKELSALVGDKISFSKTS